MDSADIKHFPPFSFSFLSLCSVCAPAEHLFSAAPATDNVKEEEEEQFRFFLLPLSLPGDVKRSQTRDFFLARRIFAAASEELISLLWISS